MNPFQHCLGDFALQVTKKPFSAREAARFLALSYRSEGKTASIRINFRSH